MIIMFYKRLLSKVVSSRYVDFAQHKTVNSVIPLPFKSLPGPKYYPLLGQFNDLITIGSADKLHLTIDNYHKKYGKIFRIKIGPTDAVFIKSADLMRSVFMFEGQYPKHPIPPAWIYFNQKFNVQRGLLFMDDNEWFHHRKIMNNLILKDFRWMEPLIESACDDFLEKLDKVASCDKFVEVRNLELKLYRWSIDVVMNLMVGESSLCKSNQQLNQLVQEFATIVRYLFETSAKLMSIPPNLADKFNLKIWKDFEMCAKKSIDLSRKIINLLKNETKCNENGLLQKMKAYDIPDDMIVRIFGDLIIAAGDTTSITTQWCIHSIAKSEELQNSLTSAMTGNPKEFDTPLVRGILREVLRLYPVAPFIGRFIDREATIGDYTIPKSTMAILSLYSSGRDIENFPRPLEFLPERWNRSSAGLAGVTKPHGTMPFAIGGRSCVGKKCANYQIHCLITKILKNFKLKSLNEEKIDFKLKLIGVPDKKIRIAIQKL